MADVIIITKIDTASRRHCGKNEDNIQKFNPMAIVIKANSSF